MNPSTVLSPEIVDLGMAIGLLKPSSDSVEFDSDWFSDPGPRVAKALADGDRRAALVRFVDAVNGESPATNAGGITLVKLFDATELGIANAPALVVNLSIDDRDANYVEVGLAVSYSTPDPVTRTDVVVPLYRTGTLAPDTSVRPVAEHFALAAGAPIRLATSIDLGDGTPDPSGFGLRQVAIAVAVPVNGSAPTLEISLLGLRLPGSTTPTDIHIGGPDSTVEEALLSLVLGVVRAGAAALGNAGETMMHALDLVGLGNDPLLPPLDVGDIAAHGVGAVRSWFTSAMADESKRRAWLGALGDVIGGNVDVPTGSLKVALNADVNLTVSVAAIPGAGGHLMVTPRLGLELTKLLGAGPTAVRLAARAEVDVVTVDLADGGLTPVPHAELFVSLTGNGTKLLDTGPAHIGTAQLGVAFTGGQVVPLVRMLAVKVGAGPEHAVVDLSSADAVVAAAGQIAGDLAATALDAFPAGVHLKPLLGLVATGGAAALDAGQLFVDPLGTLRGWWNGLVTTHQADVPTVLGHLRDLIAHDSKVALNGNPATPISGSGTPDSPWRVPVVDRVSLDVWVDAGLLVAAVNLGFRIDNLAGGCTVVETDVRAELVAVDLANGHASLLRAAELRTSMRGRGLPNARLALGPVAIVADSIGLSARWTAATGFAVTMRTPGLAAEIDGASVPLSLPAGGDWATSVFTDVERLVAVLAASNPTGWLGDVVDLLGWTLGETGSRPALHLADLAADAAAALRAWGTALVTDTDMVERVAVALSGVLTGSAGGIAGAIVGRGTPDDPWVLPLGAGEGAPALVFSLGPDGPVVDASFTSDVIRTWRPGMPGLPADGLARAVLDEALAGADGAALAFRRQGLGSGLAALALRAVNTDVLAAPPSEPIAGLEIHVHPGATFRRWLDLPITEAIGAAAPAAAATVRVAIGSPTRNPWVAAPANRIIDLSTPALSPESFVVTNPGAGEWFVLLGSRSNTSLGVSDPSGVLGQAARLTRALGALGAGRPVVVLAVGGAGHAARLAADATAAVTHLVTLGTPWSAIAFDSARNGASGDALRLLQALLPAVDIAEPDDADLALGRAIVDGFSDIAAQFELDAPRPTVAVRAGLIARGWFGGLDAADVQRGFTAVVSAGLAARARAREGAANEPARSGQLSLRVPLAGPPPPSGHGIVVDGHIELGLMGSVASPATFGVASRADVHLRISDTDSWLVGGPGTTPGNGALPLELRFIEATISVGIGGAASSAELILHEVSALGAYRDRVVIRPNQVVSGSVEELPFLPEARAVVAALVQRMRTADPASAAHALVSLFDGIGLTVGTGLVADQLSHLLHDPSGFAHEALSQPASLSAVVAGIAAMVPGASVTGSTVSIAATPGDSTVAISFDLGARRAALVASGTGMLPWTVELTGIGGTIGGSVLVGATQFNGAGVRLGWAPFTAQLVRHTATGTEIATSLWPSPNMDGVAAFARAALPAEALRIVLTAVRDLDATVGASVDALAGALGVLGPADGTGYHPIIAPVALFDDPGGWLREHVLGSGGVLTADRLIDLFEAVKPFVDLGGTARGVWPIVAGVELTVASAASGATIAVAVDPTVWLGGAGRVPFAAGVSLGLTVPGHGNPQPVVELYLGVAEQPPTSAHRGAAHVVLDAGGLRLFVRPTAGDDIALYPNPAGLGALLTAGTDLLLPMVLDQLARLSGDATRVQIASLVTAFGVGLDVVTNPAAHPVSFNGAKLHDLADNPGERLATQAGELITHVVAALHPLIHQLPGAPSATLAGSTLTVTVRGVALSVDTSPLAIGISGSVSGLPVVGTVEAALAADASGLTAWSFGVGPASFDLGGPVLRPFIRGGRAGGSGWSASLGLALDAIAPSTDGHKELFAQWNEATGLSVVARTRTSGADHDHTDAASVALFAADAVLELLGNYVITLADVAALLDKSVNGHTVRSLLQGSVLSNADDHAIAPAPVSSLPGSLFVLSRKLAGALPAVPLGPIEVGLHLDGDLVGLRVNITDANAGLVLNPSGDVVIAIVTDSSWIESPTPPSPPPPGIVIDLLTITTGASPAVTVTPAFAANGLGVKITKASGPLLDAGLRLDGVAVHLFGKLVPGAGSVDVSGGVHLELIGLGVPLGSGGGDNAVAKGVLNDAGGSGAPPTPKFSPAIAVQAHHGVNGIAVSLRAGPGDGPWYLPIQRAFGPVYLEQIGLGTGYTGNAPRTLDWISLSLDGSVSLFGISASVDKLRLTYHVDKPFFDIHSWTVDLDGFAISSSIGGLTLAGALLRSELSAPLKGVEYLGMLKIGFNGYGIDLFGGYANPDDGNGTFASFFAFGALHAPLGGVPAFFITGIGIGFGINRELKPPTMETITANPFLVAMKALGPAPEPKAQLRQMGANIGPKRGEYWVAAGISFTSFVLISGEVVVTVAFGDGLEITVLGLARAELPTPVAKLVSIELALLARFSTKEGVLLVQAQLTENSWLLTESVRLTGGFAFATWWKGPNAGQFVVTMGGYHPKFNKPGYPVVPRLGLRWQPIENISIIGESYFALCSEALMAGTRLEVSAHFGPAHARLSFGADGIVFFDPFWFEVTAWAEISAGIKIWLLFGTVTIELSLGASVTLTGPPIHVEGRFEICGFEVPFEFGDKADPDDDRLSAVQFRDKYLRASADAQMIQASVIRGGVAAGKKSDGSPQKVPDGSPLNPFLVVPEFELMLITTAPAVDMQLRGSDGSSTTKQVAVADLGVAPMFSATLQSKLHAEISKIIKSGDPAQPVSVNGITMVPRADASFPKGVWGEPQNRKSPKVPAGETIDASDGFTFSTVLADKPPTPQIDYHQVELPFAGRKPLPFVTNRTFTDQRAVQVTALKNLADAIRPVDTDMDARFNVAARLLDAGGYGTIGVAALRGERASAPNFGSLADDLVVSPSAVSPKVKPTVVDRTKAAKPFVAPMVKALMASPLSTVGTTGPITTVKDPGAAIARIAPTIDSVRGAVTQLAPASLIVRAASVQTIGRRSLAAVGVVPVTRLATSPTGAVVNARPDRAASERLAQLSNDLGDGARAGAVLHEGEVVVIAVASRATGERTDVLRVDGGPCRVVALAAGGSVLFDDVVLPDGRNARPVDIPQKTERAVVSALGTDASVGGTLDGWYLGQNLPTIGWDMALAAGSIVTFANNKSSGNRERADGGWANTRDMNDSSRVSTRFDRPVRAVAVALDDAGTAGRGDAASTVSMRLVGASRTVDTAGVPLPPKLLVQGVRTILLYAVDPEPDPEVLDPNVLVIVDGTRQGHLAGVAGSLGSVDELAEQITMAGFDAAIAAPLPGGTGARRLTWSSASAPKHSPKSSPKRGPKQPTRTTTKRGR